MKQKTSTITISNLLDSLGIDYSTEFINSQLDRSADPSSLPVIADTLEEFWIETMLVEFSMNELEQVDFPIIATISQKGMNKHVVVTKRTDDDVHFIDQGKERTLTTKHFAHFWTGIALLVAADENSKQPAFDKKKDTPFPKILSTLLFVIGALSGAYLLINAQMELTVIFTLMLKVIGGVVSLQLMLESVEGTSAFGSKLCNMGKTLNCRSVLGSKAAKILGVSMTEVGLAYFVFTSGVILIGFVANLSTLPIIKAINYIVLPYTIFSIIYQWRVVKVWCPLCLAVQLILWIEFAVLFSVQGPMMVDYSTISAMGVMLLMVPLWNKYKSKWILSKQLMGADRAFKAMKRDYKTLSLLLENGTETKPVPSTAIEMGSKDASDTLTIVTSPDCAPCKSAHKKVENIRAYFNSHLSLKIVFATDPNGYSGKAMAYFYDWRSKHDLFDAISDWYGKDKKDEQALDQWTRKYELNYEPNSLEEIIQTTKSWMSESQIKGTPSIILNGKLVSREFDLEDTKYYLREKIRQN